MRFWINVKVITVAGGGLVPFFNLLHARVYDIGCTYNFQEVMILSHADDID